MSPCPTPTADAERSAARIADIELGLTSSKDFYLWWVRALRRQLALIDDRDLYGLFPHEDAELARIEAVILEVRQLGRA